MPLRFQHLKVALVSELLVPLKCKAMFQTGNELYITNTVIRLRDQVHTFKSVLSL